jgi:hypothetical protein
MLSRNPFALAVVAGLALLFVGAAAIGLLPEREACTSPVVGEQALPWLLDTRARDLAGCRGQ